MTSSAASPSSLTCKLLGEMEMPVGMEGPRTPSTSQMAISPRCRLPAMGRRCWLAGWGRVVSNTLLSFDPFLEDLANQDMLNKIDYCKQTSAMNFLLHSVWGF